MPIYALPLALAENARLTFPINQKHDYQNALARFSQHVATCILEFCHLNLKALFAGLVTLNDSYLHFNDGKDWGWEEAELTLNPNPL